MSQQSNPTTLREAVKDMMPLIEWYVKREIEHPANHQEFARQTEGKLQRLRVALAASGTEAATSDDEHAERLYGQLPDYVSEKVSVDEFKRRIKSSAQGAASPEGEGREAQLLSEMRDFANECLRRIESYPHLDGDELHSKDTYEDILKLCDLAALRQSAAPYGALRLSEEILVDAARLIRRRKREWADNEEIEGCAMVCDAMRDDSLAQESKTGAVTDAGKGGPSRPSDPVVKNVGNASIPESWRILTPEQFQQGYSEWRDGIIYQRSYDWHRKLEDGNGLVSEPRESKTVATTNVVHGYDCVKQLHRGTGYLHDESADKPYDVDGLKYCGRCHVAL